MTYSQCTGKKSQGTSGKFRKVTHRRTKRFDQFKRSDFNISHAYGWAARSDRCGAELAYPYCAPQALPQNKREPEPHSMTLRLRVARSSIERDAQWDRDRTQIFSLPPNVTTPPKTQKGEEENWRVVKKTEMGLTQSFQPSFISPT